MTVSIASGSQAVIFGLRLAYNPPPFVWIQTRRGANCKVVYWFGEGNVGLSEDGMCAVRNLFHQYRTRDCRGEYVVTSSSGLCVTPSRFAEALSTSLSLLLRDPRLLGPALSDEFAFKL